MVFALAGDSTMTSCMAGDDDPYTCTYARGWWPAAGFVKRVLGFFPLSPKHTRTMNALISQTIVENGYLIAITKLRAAACDDRAVVHENAVGGAIVLHKDRLPFRYEAAMEAGNLP